MTECPRVVRALLWFSLGFCLAMWITVLFLIPYSHPALPPTTTYDARRVQVLLDAQKRCLLLYPNDGPGWLRCVDREMNKRGIQQV